MRKIVWATLSYTIVTMVIAFPWHFVWFKDLYHGFGIYNRAEPIVPLGFLTMLIQGVILAYLYPRYYKGGSHYKEAVQFSLLIGLFLYSVSTLANAAKIEVSPMGTWLVVQAAFHAVQFVVSGLALGFIHARK